MAIILHDAQKKIASDLHRFRVIAAGRRTGKTALAVLEMLAKAIAGRERRIAYISPTYQSSRDIAWNALKDSARGVIIDANESRLELTVRTIKGGKSTIFLRGWESVDTLRGQRFDFLVIDEVASMRGFELNWQEVLRPTLTDTQGEAMFISTPRGFNHFYDLYNKEAEDTDYKSFHFTTYDNPHIPKEEIDKAKQELTEDRFHQEYLADFRKMEGLVYKEFDRRKHLYTEKKFHTIDRLAGVDFGFTNPSAIVVVERDTDANYWISSEWYKTGRTTAELIEYARTLKVNKFYPDPAEPDRIEEMRRAGLNVRDVSKDIKKGIDAVRTLFKDGRLHIHVSCVNLISELESYHYPDKQPDKNEPELPVKEYDHALDALRYCLHMQEPLGANAYKPKVFRPKHRSRNPTPKYVVDRV